MKRSDFLKRLMVSSAAASAAPSLLKATNKLPKQQTSNHFLEQVGFNHLPAENTHLSTSKTTDMKTVLHKADTRGLANHGWLKSRHTFSFANYRNPERMHFGVLRVLNDDQVAPGKGFGSHPHDNMEIVSIPLEGDLEHKDSMGNTTVIREGDVQVMSAGTGVFHSEYNHNADKDVKFLQIWIIPNQKEVTPRYDQISLENIRKQNEFYQILSPNKNDQGVWIHQNAWFHLGEFDKSTTTTYKLNDEANGVYAFILEGEATIANQVLTKRDGLGVWDTNTFEIKTNGNARILLMEVPLNI